MVEPTEPKQARSAMGSAKRELLDLAFYFFSLFYFSNCKDTDGHTGTELSSGSSAGGGGSGQGGNALCSSVYGQ